MITSDYVERELAYRFVEAEDFNVQTFVSATQSHSTLAHFRGYAVEAFAHRALTRENDVRMTIRMISSMGESVNVASGVIVEALRFPTFRSYVDFEHLTDVPIGVYHKPRRKNEPTIDSWSVVSREFVEKRFPNEPQLADKSIHLFIVFFQVTISESHVVDGTILRKWVTILKAKLNVAKLPILFVFVTTKGGIQTMQTVTWKAKKQNRKPFEDQSQFGCQYAICLHDRFEDLAAKLQEERREMERIDQKAFDERDEDSDKE